MWGDLFAGLKMSYNPSTSLEKELSIILGVPILVQVSEDYSGFCIRDMNSMQPLLNDAKIPKKFDAEWIINKIESKAKNNEDMKIRRKAIIAAMQKSLKDKNICNFNAYETTFGFSVCNIFQDGLKVAKECIETCGIQYKRIEYSDAHWVVRVFL